MKICKSINEVRQFLKESKESAGLIGFVPTMGCLHQGHLSLVKRSKEENSKTIVSIFVNPLQFVQGEDYECYPRTQAEDLTLLRAVEVDMVFIPENGLIYPNGKILELSEKKLSSQLCGMHRPGHFDGVLQVVLKLLNIVQCDRLYLGEKDYQQWMLIDLMVKELFLNLQVIACPIVRESDGLAMSSRNRYLSKAERKVAAEFPRILIDSREQKAQVGLEDIELSTRRKLEDVGFLVDYVRILDSADLTVPEEASSCGKLRIFAAVRLGSTRLIDNMEWRLK